MSEQFTMTYRLTPDLRRDAIMYTSRHFARRGKGLLGLFWAAIAGVAIAVGANLIQRFLVPGTDSGVLLLAFMAGFLCCYALWKYSHRQQIKAVVQDAGAGDEETQAVLNADGVAFRDAHSQSFLKWSAVQEVWEMETAVVLRVNSVSFPLPLSGLPGGMKKDDLVAAIRSWREPG